MRTLTVLSAFLLGLGAVLVFANQSVQAQDQPVAPVPVQPYQGGEQQPGGGAPPWMQRGGQQPGGGSPPWMQRGGQQPGGPGGMRGPGVRGGPPPGAVPGGARPTPGGMDANRVSMMMARLRSMDTNGNGILEPQEISDSRRSFVNAIVTQMGGDPNGPIDLARLERRAMSIANAQTNTPRQSQPPDPTAGRQSRQPAPTVDPLVPPFGESKPVETPTLGFGQRDAGGQQDGRGSGRQRTSPASIVAVNQPPAINNTNSIKQSAVYDALPETVRNNPQFNWFFSYDADRDGQLTMSEYIRGRGGVLTKEIAEEFRQLDRNGDGFVTVDEALTTIKEWDEDTARKAKEQQEAATLPPPGQPVSGQPTAGTSGVRTPREGSSPGYQGRQSYRSGGSGSTPSGRDRRSGGTQ